MAAWPGRPKIKEALHEGAPLIRRAPRYPVMVLVEASGQHELNQVQQLQKRSLMEWKEKAAAGSAKLAHGYFKNPAEIPKRPFDEVPFDERPEQRG